jgi:molybdopterin converting factor small subunit
MPITLLIPTALRTFTDHRAEVTAEGRTVGEALAAFASTYPDLRPHLYDEKGAPRSFINIFLGERNIKTLNGLETPVADGDTVRLIPAIAGGRSGRRGPSA